MPKFYLTLSDKMNMSLDDIIKFKLKHDPVYRLEREKELDQELVEYFAKRPKRKVKNKQKKIIEEISEESEYESENSLSYSSSEETDEETEKVVAELLKDNIKLESDKRILSALMVLLVFACLFYTLIVTSVMLENIKKTSNYTEYINRNIEYAINISEYCDSMWPY